MSIFSMLNFIFDVLYAFKSLYYTKGAYVATLIFLALRVHLCYTVVMVGHCCKVKKASPSRGQVWDYMNKAPAVATMSVAGFYRTLSTLEFRGHVVRSYAIEFFSQLLPLLVIQTINNNALEGSMLPVQTMSMILKIILLCNIMVEIGLLLCEIRYNRRNKLESAVLEEGVQGQRQQAEMTS
jgi:hypothetical protein